MQEARRQQQRIAEITELIHVASLLHDDVIDDAETRRGLKALNLVFGNKIAILAGATPSANVASCRAKTPELWTCCLALNLDYGGPRLHERFCRPLWPCALSLLKPHPLLSFSGSLLQFDSMALHLTFHCPDDVVDADVSAPTGHQELRTEVGLQLCFPWKIGTLHTGNLN